MRLVREIEVRDLVEDDIRQHALGADRGAVIQRLLAKVVRVLAENFALAGCRANFVFDAEQNRDILEGMQAVRDEKWDDDDVRCWGHFIPLGDERRLLHVGIHDGGVTSSRCGDEVCLVANGLGRVLVETGAVASDDQSRKRGIHPGRDLFGALEDQIRHRAMNSDGEAIVESFPAHLGGGSLELEFTRDDVLGEITLADEVGDDVNFVGIDQIERFSERGFFFPETAMDLRKEPAFADLVGMVKIRRG